MELLAPEVCETVLPLKRGVGETVSPPACGQDVALSTMALQRAQNENHLSVQFRNPNHTLAYRYFAMITIQ